MDTNGYSNFDNDAALDWLLDFCEEPSIIKIDSALVLVLDEQNNCESIDCEEAITAAEVVAALFGKPFAAFPEEELAVVKSCGITLSPSYKVRTSEVLKKIMQQSELKEIWEETNDAQEWHAAMSELLRRLS